MADRHPGMRAWAERGERRGPEAVAAEAVREAARRTAAPMETPRRHHWVPAAVVLATVAALAAMVVFVRREPHHSVTATAGSHDASVGTTGASVSGGWVFDLGAVRELSSGRTVATFPSQPSTDGRPVRVRGGFVAALGGASREELWFAPDGNGSATRLAPRAVGVAVSSDGTTLAYSDLHDGALASTLTLYSLSQERVVTTTSFAKAARVIGFSGSGVWLETGDGADSHPAYWDPAAGTVQRLDRYTLMGGVVRGYGIFNDDACASWRTIATDGTVAPPGGDYLDPTCTTDRWTMNGAAPSRVVGYGIDGHPVPLRIKRITDSAAVVVSSTSAVDAVWIDATTVAAINANGNLERCDGSTGACTQVDGLGRSRHLGDRWLIAPPLDPVYVVGSTVTGANPLLLPRLIEQYWSATADADAHSFRARYTEMSTPGSESFELSISIPNPPTPDTASQRYLPFRGDPRAFYQIDDKDNPTSSRYLMWNEPGTWDLPSPGGGVPYLLRADGLTDTAFWAVANSLQRVDAAPPAAPPSSTPTPDEIASVMSRTVFTDDHQRHYLPAGDPVTVSDGGTGTLTAAVGVPTDTADAGGQVAFFWHNDVFIGWNSNHMTFKIGVEPAGPDSVRLTYIFIKPGEAACCASGQDPIIYRWDGTRLVSDHQPSPDILGPTIELTN